MTTGDWIRLANDVSNLHIALAVLLVLAAVGFRKLPAANPLRNTCAAYSYCVIGSYLVWQSCPVSIMEDEMWRMADPANSPTASMVVSYLFPNYHPYWMYWPGYLVITLVCVNLGICAYIILAVYLDGCAKRSAREEDTETAPAS